MTKSAGNWIWSHLLKKSLMENFNFLWSVTGSGKFKANFHIFCRWSRICKQHIKCPKQIWDGWIQLFSYPMHLCRYLLVSMYYISTYIMFQQWRFMMYLNILVSSLGTTKIFRPRLYLLNFDLRQECYEDLSEILEETFVALLKLQSWVKNVKTQLFVQ